MRYAVCLGFLIALLKSNIHPHPDHHPQHHHHPHPHHPHHHHHDIESLPAQMLLVEGRSRAKSQFLSNLLPMMEQQQCSIFSICYIHCIVKLQMMEQQQYICISFALLHCTKASNDGTPMQYTILIWMLLLFKVAQ